MTGTPAAAPATPPPDPLRVDAEPNKALFIHWLTRDTLLSDAIKDLVDNSVDAARARAKSRKEKKLNGYKIELQIGPGEFKIDDTCGGMTPSVARHYAFRFGNAEGTVDVEGNVGRFGIGMKRAMFKIGKTLYVDSRSDDGCFKMTIKVESWKQERDWAFKFDAEPTMPSGGERGLSIKAEDIYPLIAESFGDAGFLEGLRKRVGETHGAAIEDGLSIKINGDDLKDSPPEIINSSELPPRAVDDALDHPGINKPVSVRIVVGVGKSSPRDAGWYVYCNRRLLLRADKSDLTWDEPKYHNQYARFRGYVYFDSSDGAALPWNTSKSALDPENPVFRRMRPTLIEGALKVIRFLDEVKKEIQDGEETSLQDALKTGERELVSPRSVSSSEKLDFGFKGTKKPKKEEMTSIAYKRPARLVERAKKLLQASSNKEVGEMTFDYFMRAEG